MPFFTGRTSWRWIPRILVTAFAALILALGLAVPAHAHASLLGTDPAEGAVLATSPTQLTLRFDEPISLPDKAIQLFDAAGAAVPANAAASDTTVTVTVPDELAGSYLLAWRVISADGHPVAGSLNFAVGAPSPHRVQPVVSDAPSWVAAPLAVTQMVAYLGLFLAVGLGVFAAFVLPSGAGGVERLRPVLRTVGRYASGVAIAASVALLGLTVADQQGLDPDGLLTLRPLTGATPDQLIALALLVAGLLLVGVGARPRTAQLRQVVVGAGTAITVVAPSVTGHSRAFGPAWLVIATDILHVLAGSIWFGSLVGLVIVLAMARRRRPALAAIALVRFSALAAAVLGLLLASGTVLAWRILGNWQDLFGTGYGQLLLAKIALVGVASAVAGWNRFVLLPRLRAVTVDGASRRQRRDAEEATGQGLFRIGRLVAVEASILVLVLGITGVLVDQSPHPAAAAVRTGAPVVAAAPLGDSLTALATVAPGAVGRNLLLVQIQDASGDPVETAHPPTVRVRSDAVDLGAVPVRAQASGTYQSVVVLPHPGQWRVQVGLRLDEFDNPVTELMLAVS